MARILKNFIFLTGLLLIAVGLIYGLNRFFQFPLSEAIIISGIGFCVIIAIYNNLVLQRHIQNSSRYIVDIQQYEQTISDRFKLLEQQLNQKAEQIKGKEETDTALSQISEATNVLADISQTGNAGGQARNPAAKPEQADNIIELNTRIKSKDAKQNTKAIKFSRSDLTKAIKSGDVELFLQPVMELPSRDIHFFEGFPRIRFDDKILAAKQFMPIALDCGKAAELDLISLDLVFKVIRQLQRMDNNSPVFWNISAHLLGNKKLFKEVVEQLKANQPLNRQLVCEIRHNALSELNSNQRDNLAEIRDLGFELSLDGVNPDLSGDMSIERIMDQKLFSILKVAANDLLRIGSDQVTNFANQIVPLAFQHDIKLIANNVDEDYQSVSMIDADIYLAQGDALMPAKAIKKEIYGS